MLLFIPHRVPGKPAPLRHKGLSELHFKSLPWKENLKENKVPPKSRNKRMERNLHNFWRENILDVTEEGLNRLPAWEHTPEATSQFFPRPDGSPPITPLPWKITSQVLTRYYDHNNDF